MSAHCYLNALGVVSALGASGTDVARRAFLGESGVLPSTQFSIDAPLSLGAVTDVLPDLSGRPLGLQSRNNQMAQLAASQLRATLEPLIARFGAHRVAVVVGTSTSGIGEAEAAFRRYAVDHALPATFTLGQQELVSVARFLSAYFGVSGPAYVHSSACASGAKAMASAARMLRQGLADVVITGGVDALCAFTIAGFSALNLVSPQRCNPLSANRNGINIGEAAALFIMSREPAAVRLSGWGESSDGHHFSAPDPAGNGARLAIQSAIARAGITSDAVEYLNLHATGTRANDAMEGAVVHALFGDRMPVSGTKPLTGHTLGAAGALEAALCWLTMQDENRSGALPVHLWDGERDPEIPFLRLVAAGDTLGHPPRVTASTSFAFGGANAVLILGRD